MLTTRTPLVRPLTAGAALALLGATAGAQEPSFTARTIVSNAEGLQSIFVLDFNGDGDLDVISGLFDGTNGSLNISQSSGDPDPTFSNFLLVNGLGAVRTIFPAQLDGDGFVEIVYAEEDTGTVAYRDNGNTIRVISTQAIGSRSVIAEDLDGDGDIDIAGVSINDSDVVWYENEGGNPATFTERLIAGNHLGAFNVHVGDFNGDGSPDIYSCSFGANQVRLHRSNGAADPAFTPNTQLATEGDDLWSVFPADLDGDGDEDVVYSSNGTGEVFWIRNNGPVQGAQTFVVGGEGGVREIFPADIDGDGDVDIAAVSGTGNRLVVFYNRGGSVPAFERRVIASNITGATDVFCADLDLDGDTDIVTSSDSGGRIRWFENEGGLSSEVENVTSGADSFSSLADALRVASPGDELVTRPARFIDERFIDLTDPAVLLRSTRELTQPGDATVLLGDGAELRARGVEETVRFGVQEIVTAAQVDSAEMTLFGSVSVEPGAFATLRAPAVSVTALGNVRLGFGSGLLIESENGVSFDGLLDVGPGASVEVDASLAIGGANQLLAGSLLSVNGSLTNGAPFELIGGTIHADAGLTNTDAFTGFGTVIGGVANAGAVTVQADLTVAGDYDNTGTTTIQNGVLTVLGSFTNSGTIDGDIVGGRGLAPRLFVDGDLVLDAGASLGLPGNAVVTLTGDYDNAIDDAARFDLSQAELRLGGQNAEQRLEVMSADIGPFPDGLDAGTPGSFPLGTLRVALPGTNALGVDARVNSGSGTPEVIYAHSVVVDAGATLDLTGVVVYFAEAEILGTVVNPGNLIPIDFSCGPADFDGDGDINVLDVVAFVSNWNAQGPGADFDDDGSINVLDVVAFIQVWNAGCP